MNTLHIFHDRLLAHCPWWGCASDAQGGILTRGHVVELQQEEEIATLQRLPNLIQAPLGLDAFCAEGY